MNVFILLRHVFVRRDPFEAYGPLLVRRLELVQEMTVNAANMEDQEQRNVEQQRNV